MAAKWRFLGRVLLAFTAVCCGASASGQSAPAKPREKTTTGAPKPSQARARLAASPIAGTLVIPPQFEAVTSFSEGLAAVRQNGKWGYVDKTGRQVIQALFDNASPFSEGLAPVRQNGQWGFIDRKGKYVVPPQFKGIGEGFSDGWALVTKEGKGSFGYIDKAGKVVILSQFDVVANFSDGRASAGVTVDGAFKIGFIDKTLTLVIPAQFDSVNHFRDGLALVRKGRAVSYIDSTGATVLTPNAAEIDEIDSFREGLARAKKGKKWGFVDKTATFVVAPEFDYVSEFSEGLAVVVEQVVDLTTKVSELDKWIGRPATAGKVGFIDKAGILVISTPLFNSMGSFSEGLARVAIYGSSGHLDTNGKWKVDTRVGYIDKVGTLLIPAQFEDGQPFKEGLAAVQQSGKWGFVGLPDANQSIGRGPI